MENKTFSQMKDAEIWNDLTYATFKDQYPLQNVYRLRRILECCRAMKALKERGMKNMFFFHGKQKYEVAKMNFCPECGRRL